MSPLIHSRSLMSAFGKLRWIRIRLHNAVHVIQRRALTCRLSEVVWRLQTFDLSHARIYLSSHGKRQSKTATATGMPAVKRTARKLDLDTQTRCRENCCKLLEFRTRLGRYADPLESVVSLKPLASFRNGIDNIPIMLTHLWLGFGGAARRTIRASDDSDPSDGHP
jgi:hypothetical protein